MMIKPDKTRRIRPPIGEQTIPQFGITECFMSSKT